jgi:hypothetical protein
MGHFTPEQGMIGHVSPEMIALPPSGVVLCSVTLPSR